MTDTSTQVFRNYYTFENDLSLTNDASGVRFGRSITQYEIRRRRDVKNLDSIMGYVLMMKQRIIIPSTTNYQPGTRSQSSYKNYPAILSNKVTLKANNGADILLQEMFPRTLNSQVSTSTTVGNSTGTSTTQQNTSGSSDTNVNTFGIGISGGMFGELPFVSLSSEYSHSWQNTKMHSQIQGSSLSENHSSGAASTMSIKDWSSYGYLDNKGINPTWLWGQSYPWDVIQYNQTKNGTTINLPDFVQSRLLSDDLVLPPSQLSLFGLDFIMTAGWIINFPKGMSEDETITILHTTQSFIASHEKDGDSISATLQSSSAANQSQYSSGTLSLSKYALDPIMSAGSDNGAAIGFKANPFTYPPHSGSIFKILSLANNLQVTGMGFEADMTTDFSKPANLTVTFKITDTSVSYSLLFMHWIGKNSSNCEINYTINGKWTGVLLVSSIEGEGGQNNISAIDLRNTDFTSINFHDYLIQGTNTIKLKIVPTDASISNKYTLFALAVGQE